MALIYCPECKQKVSDSAKTCPHCGYDLQNNDFRLHEVKDIDNIEKQSTTANKSTLKSVGNFARRTIHRIFLFISCIFMLIGIIVLIVAGAKGSYPSIYSIGGIFLGIGIIGFIFNIVRIKSIK